MILPTQRTNSTQYYYINSISASEHLIWKKINNNKFVRASTADRHKRWKQTHKHWYVDSNWVIFDWKMIILYCVLCSVFIWVLFRLPPCCMCVMVFVWLLHFSIKPTWYSWRRVYFQEDDFFLLSLSLDSIICWLFFKHGYFGKFFLCLPKRVTRLIATFRCHGLFFQDRIRVCSIKIMKKIRFFCTKVKKIDNSVPHDDSLTDEHLMGYNHVFPCGKYPIFFILQKPKQTSNMNFMIFFLFVHFSIIPQTNSRSLIIFHKYNRLLLLFLLWSLMCSPLIVAVCDVI